MTSRWEQISVKHAAFGRVPGRQFKGLPDDQAVATHDGISIVVSEHPGRTPFHLSHGGLLWMDIPTAVEIGLLPERLKHREALDTSQYEAEINKHLESQIESSTKFSLKIVRDAKPEGAPASTREYREGYEKGLLAANELVRSVRNASSRGEMSTAFFTALHPLSKGFSPGVRSPQRREFLCAWLGQLAAICGYGIARVENAGTMEIGIYESHMLQEEFNKIAQEITPLAKEDPYIGMILETSRRAVHESMSTVRGRDRILYSCFEFIFMNSGFVPK